ncbi:MAG: zeta toxin family protein [Lysobacter sp.]
MRPLAPPLEAGLHQEIFERQILSAVGYADIPSHRDDQPTAIILAGQPGAGKSGVAKQAMADLGGPNSALVVDPDSLRDFHPRVDTFRKDSPYDWADDTHKDASQWAKELRGKAIEDRKNLVIDTTLGDGGKAVELVKGLQDAGYKVEIRALATHRLESELGVDARFTGSLDRNGFGRFVPPNIREQVYRDLPGNLDKVQAETVGAPIRIYNREAEKLYDSTLQTQVKPGAALADAREQRIQSPDIAKSQHENWSAQMNWHMNLEGRLERTGADQHKAYESREALLQERSDHAIVAGVSKNSIEASRNWDSVHEASRSANLASITPITFSSTAGNSSLTAATPSHSSTTLPLAQMSQEDQKLYQAIRGGLPNTVSDHKALEATVAAKNELGMRTPEDIGKVGLTDSGIFVAGKVPGHVATVSVSTQPPSSEILQQQLQGNDPSKTPTSNLNQTQDQTQVTKHL